jgi:hypothetical protein
MKFRACSNATATGVVTGAALPSSPVYVARRRDIVGLVRPKHRPLFQGSCSDSAGKHSSPPVGLKRHFDGVFEASSGGILIVDDPVIGTGSALIAGGTLIFEASSTINVTFDNSGGTSTYGELVLADASHFSGQIFEFSGNEADATQSDAIDLVGFTYGSTVFSESISNGHTVPTATDGSAVALLTFNNFDGTLDFASDGKGGSPH